MTCSYLPLQEFLKKNIKPIESLMQSILTPVFQFLQALGH
jgi:hypothetical protein